MLLFGMRFDRGCGPGTRPMDDYPTAFLNIKQMRAAETEVFLKIS
jgi:hypothetical protein